MTLQPRKAGETFTTDRVTPAEMFVRDLDGEYYLLSEVAEMVGVTSQTLRRLIKHPEKKVKAPSFIAHQGKMPLYIFTREDVDEIKAHYQRRYEGFDVNSTRGRGRPKNKKDT